MASKIAWAVEYFKRPGNFITYTSFQLNSFFSKQISFVMCIYILVQVGSIANTSRLQSMPKPSRAGVIKEKFNFCRYFFVMGLFIFL